MCSRWGNVLSPYWMGRAIGELSGRSYTGGVFGRGSWMEYLPTAAEAKKARIDKWEHACTLCTHSNSWEFAHTCLAGWPSILPTMQKDTRSALVKYSQEKKTGIPWHTSHEKDQPGPGKDNEWVIYDRCTTGENNICGHPEYGPSGFSFYLHLPKNTKLVIHVQTPDGSQVGKVCKRFQDAREEFLKRYTLTLDVCHTPSHEFDARS